MLHRSYCLLGGILRNNTHGIRAPAILPWRVVSGFPKPVTSASGAPLYSASEALFFSN
jgi:hypothetical protein